MEGVRGGGRLRVGRGELGGIRGLSKRVGGKGFWPGREMIVSHECILTVGSWRLTHSDINHLIEVILLHRSIPLHLRQDHGHRMLRDRTTTRSSPNRAQCISPKLEPYSSKGRLSHRRRDVMQFKLFPDQLGRSVGDSEPRLLSDSTHIECSPT